ncbi:MAG: hypothetical protein K8S87_02360, partial [Planctomycetes bacterium]|nr:hypothetical protein [Planctomycetota bacterium]
MKILIKWKQLVERKRNSMPNPISKLNIGLMIAFVLLIFGIIASFATFSSVTAQSNRESKLNLVSQIEINEPITLDTIVFIKERLKIAEYDNNFGIAVIFNSTEIDFEIANELTKILLRNNKLHKIAFVSKRIESFLLIPLLVFDEIVLEFTETNTAIIGPYNQKIYSDEVISEAISYFRGSKDKQLIEYAALIEKFFDKTKSLYFKTSSGLTSFSMEKLEEYKLLTSEGKLLILTPTEAEKLGIASLIIDNTFADFLKKQEYTVGKRYVYKLTGATIDKKADTTENILSRKDFENNRAIIIDISTDIGEVVADSIERRIDAALEKDISMIILKLDTPGGRIDSTLKIIKKIEEASKKIVTVAWVDTEAISAGAMIAITCKYIAMSERSKIGDCQPIIPTNAGYEVAGEKIQTYLRVHFRQYARQHGIPEALGEAMVTQELKVIEIKPRSQLYANESYPRFMIEEEFESWNERNKFEKVRTIVREDELLTLTDVEAREYGFALNEIKTFDELKSYFDVRTVVESKTTASEDLLRFLNAIAPLIIGLGMLGLFIEMKTPGFGLFGTLGIAIIGGFFSIKFLVGMAEYWEILLFAGGIILVIVEVFIIPGTGLFGIAGVLAILGGIFFAGQSFIIPETSYQSDLLIRNFSSIIFSVIGALIAFYFAVKYLHKIPIIRNLILDTGQDTSELHASAVDVKTDELVGAIGTTTTDLRPVGKAIIGNELKDVQVLAHDYIE